MTEKFDGMMAKMNADLAEGEKWVTEATKELRLAKNSAYRMAQTFIAAQAEDAEGLAEYCREKFPDAADPLAAWVRSNMGAFEMTGEDGWELIQRVRDGLTLEQYLAESPPVYTGKPARD